MKKKKRVSFFWIFTIIMLLVWFVGTFCLRTTTTEIFSNKVNDEITIVHLSDLHGAVFGRNNSKLLNKVREEKPDIVCVTGDMYTNGDADGKKVALELLGNLAKEFEVYFVNGEHDRSTEYLEKLPELGVKVLDYKDEIIEIKNTKIHIYGIDNIYYSQTFDLNNEFEIDTENFTLLLAHITNFAKFSDFGIDLSLCGDTHGGQVRLPYVGAVTNRDIWFPEIKGTGEVVYTDGLYSKGNSQLYVSSGLGNGPIPIRFMNLPEVSVLKIKPEK